MTTTSSPEKVRTLITKLEALVACLEGRIDLSLHMKIDQFFYMQKISELELLAFQFEETVLRLSDIDARLELTYCSAFRRWRSDARLLRVSYETKR